MTNPATSQFTADDYVPLSVWGKDHHSTIAYVDTVMVECGGFQVGADPRMRSNRRNLRVMFERCPQPIRPGGKNVPMLFAPAIERGQGSRLNNGQTVDNHDDWCCLQDAAAEGLFTVGPEEVEPGETLHFSGKGRAYIGALRAHKSAGGNFAAFAFKQEAAA